MYLLDTNIISDIVRNPHGPAASRFAETSADDVCTSVVVSAEVLFGFAKTAGHRLEAAMRAILDSIQILGLEQPVDRNYAAVRSALKDQGKPIGPNDLWIAAHALALDAVLVTGNEQEFSRVPGLKVENWLAS